jgi:hypothetical protein
MPRSSQLPICSLCHETVEIETAKTDEDGKAVHEECYALKTRPIEAEHMAISPMTLTCPRCGATAGQVALYLTAKLR